MWFVESMMSAIFYLLAVHQLSSSMPNLSALEFGQSSDLLNTAPSPVAVLPILVLPSVLKLPI
jgi:hypothetical protein